MRNVYAVQQIQAAGGYHQHLDQQSPRDIMVKQTEREE
jgi:hypothetical protein